MLTTTPTILAPFNATEMAVLRKAANRAKREARKFLNASQPEMARVHLRSYAFYTMLQVARSFPISEERLGVLMGEA